LDLVLTDSSGATANAPQVTITVTIPPSALPKIASFTPDSGTTGTTVTISGSGLTGATSVKFNGQAASTFSVDSDTSITATVSATALTGKVSVTTPSGTASSATSFTVLPMITSFTPTSRSPGTTSELTSRY